MLKKIGLSLDLQQKILSAAGQWNASDVAKNILKLSDHFAQKKTVITPWEDKGLAQAYLLYNLPLGMARVCAVVFEARQMGFFENFEHLIDFGSGPGTVDLVFQESKIAFSSKIFVEKSSLAKSIHRELNNQTNFKLDFQFPVQSKSLFSASYSLNELTQLPEKIFEADGIMVLEPSTHGEFQNLAKLRMQLIQKNWHVWAPCTHSEKCPLWNERDWCHSRLIFDPPIWWKDIEQHLPIKNHSVTFSYLLAHKSKAIPKELLKPKLLTADAKGGVGRVVGDVLEERGKTKQMLCRSSEREFMSWLHKWGPVPEVSRGDLVVISPDYEKKSNEIRIRGEK